MSSRVQQFKQGLAPSSSRVQQFRQQLQNPTPQPIPQPQRPTVGARVGAGINQSAVDVANTAVGTGKGILNTLNNVSKIGQKALGGIAGLFGIKAPTASLPEKFTTPTQSQKPGFVGEQIGEFFLPGGATSKLNKTINTAAQSTKLGPLASLGFKAATKAGVEGTAAGAVRYGQTLNPKESVKAGVTAGALAGGTSIVGDVLRAARIPEWFQSKVFHNSKADMLDELKTVGDKNIQKTDPELFKQLTDAGVIKQGADGKVILNETLAKEAVDRGLKGNIKTMANAVVKTNRQSEVQARALAATHKAPIKIEPQYERLLKELADDYKDVGFGEETNKAFGMLQKIKNGQTDASTALELRRFLDGMRYKASFNPTTKLTQTQQNFKSLADRLRERLAKEVTGMEPVMNDYRFSIEALQALAQKAAQSGNREALSLIDTVFLSGGIAGQMPGVGVVAGLSRRILNSPKGTTSIAQGLNNLGNGLTKKGAFIRSGAAFMNSGGLKSNQDNQSLLRR